ncbi:MAG TPA: thiamine pyrophosphate-dependent enzyme [Stellaceae bacterium]
MANNIMTTAQAVTQTLLAQGIDTVYGLPGTHNDDLFDAFYAVRDRLRFIHTRHEQGGAFMALGASLVTGKPQVFTVVPGPGLLNAGAAILTAQAMNAPILCIVGQIPQREIDRGHGYLHEIRDQVGLARHISKFAARIDSAADAPRLVAQAFVETQRGRPGPVILECGMDVWGRKGAVGSFETPSLPLPPPVDDDAVARAAAILGKAKRPIIVVGGGAQGASAEITALAEALEAPVIAYRRGQGVVSARHRLSVNMPIGHRLWKDADAVLAVGTRLLIQQTQWGTDKDLPIVRIDIEEEEPARLAPPAVAIVADAREAASALLRALPAHNSKRAPADLTAHRAWLAERLSRLEPQTSFLRAMRNALPENGVFVDEVTQLGFASRLAFPVYAPRTYFSPGYQDALGWGYGTALGVKAARPDLPVLAISGDGGFLYQATELATAMHHNIAVVAVVFDNAAFGNVRLIQKERFGGRLIADSLTNPDFVKFAESFGAAAFRATTAPELERAVTDALALNRPALIHVPVGEMPSPWDMIMMPRVRG